MLKKYLTLTLDCAILVCLAFVAEDIATKSQLEELSMLAIIAVVAALGICALARIIVMLNSNNATVINLEM